MRHSEKIAPLAAAVGSLATLTCCLPIGFAGAAALAGIGATVAPLRDWFIGGAVVLLLVGAVQVNRAQRTCAANGRHAWASLAILFTSATIVALVALFPQVVASILADWMP